MPQIIRPTLICLLGAAAGIIAFGHFGHFGHFGDDASRPLAAAASSAVAAPNAARVAPAPRPTDLRVAVRDLSYWPLPGDAQLRGVSRSRLADSLEGWIGGLPAPDQERARQFAARYAPAYDISDKAVQAWLLEMGFPSLEEFAAFDYTRDAADCPAQSCNRPKVAALSADHFITQMEQLLPPAAAGDVSAVDALSEADRQSAMQSYVKAGLYTDRLRQSGQVLVAAYLEMRREQVLGHSSRASASQLFIAACGDPRMDAGAASVSLATAVLQHAHGSPCNRAGKPQFPALVSALAAAH